MHVGNAHKHGVFGQMRKRDGIGYHISEVRMGNLQNGKFTGKFTG